MASAFAEPHRKFKPYVDGISGPDMGTYNPVLRKKAPKMTSFPAAERKSEYLINVVKQTADNPGVGAYSLRREYYPLPAGGNAKSSKPMSFIDQVKKNAFGPGPKFNTGKEILKKSFSREVACYRSPTMENSKKIAKKLIPDSVPGPNMYKLPDFEPLNQAPSMKSRNKCSSLPHPWQHILHRNFEVDHLPNNVSGFAAKARATGISHFNSTGIGDFVQDSDWGFHDEIPDRLKDDDDHFESIDDVEPQFFEGFDTIFKNNGPFPTPPSGVVIEQNTHGNKPWRHNSSRRDLLTWEERLHPRFHKASGVYARQERKGITPGISHTKAELAKQKLEVYAGALQRGMNGLMKDLDLDKIKKEADKQCRQAAAARCKLDGMSNQQTKRVMRSLPSLLDPAAMFQVENPPPHTQSVLSMQSDGQQASQQEHQRSHSSNQQPSTQTGSGQTHSTSQVHSHHASVEQAMSPRTAVATSVAEGAVNPSSVAAASAMKQQEQGHSSDSKSKHMDTSDTDDNTFKGSTVLASSPGSPQAAGSPRAGVPASSAPGTNTNTNTDSNAIPQLSPVAQPEVSPLDQTAVNHGGYIDGDTQQYHPGPDPSATVGNHISTMDPDATNVNFEGVTATQQPTATMPNYAGTGVTSLDATNINHAGNISTDYPHQPMDINQSMTEANHAGFTMTEASPAANVTATAAAAVPAPSAMDETVVNNAGNATATGFDSTVANNANANSTVQFDTTFPNSGGNTNTSMPNSNLDVTNPNSGGNTSTNAAMPAVGLDETVANAAGVSTTAGVNQEYSVTNLNAQVPGTELSETNPNVANMTVGATGTFVPGQMGTVAEGEAGYTGEMNYTGEFGGTGQQYEGQYPQYAMDEQGNYLMDEQGNYIPLVQYMTDENGNYVQDENGNYIPLGGGGGAYQNYDFGDNTENMDPSGASPKSQGGFSVD